MMMKMILGGDGWTKFIMSFKEQETHLTLQEHVDDDDDDDPRKRWIVQLHHEDPGTGNTPNTSGI